MSKLKTMPEAGRLFAPATRQANTSSPAESTETDPPLPTFSNRFHPKTNPDGQTPWALLLDLPNDRDKTVSDWRYYVRLCCEVICGYCSIPKDYFKRIGMTIEDVLSGLPYEYYEGMMSVSFKKKGRATFDSADAQTKRKKHEAPYVWKTLV